MAGCRVLGTPVLPISILGIHREPGILGVEQGPGRSNGGCGDAGWRVESGV